MEDKIYARFLTPVMVEDSSKPTIKVAGKPFQYTSLNEVTAKCVLEQASLYYLSDSYRYEYEYDEDPSPTVSTGTKNFEIATLVSNSSSTYSTDAPTADMVVINGQFIGVILYLRRSGGNGFSNYNSSGYTFFNVDGTILGDNKASYYFSGESSSKYYDDEYFLVKK